MRLNLFLLLPLLGLFRVVEFFAKSHDGNFRAWMKKGNDRKTAITIFIWFTSTSFADRFEIEDMIRRNSKCNIFYSFLNLNNKTSHKNLFLFSVYSFSHHQDRSEWACGWEQGMDYGTNSKEPINPISTSWIFSYDQCCIRAGMGWNQIIFGFRCWETQSWHRVSWTPW